MKTLIALSIIATFVLSGCCQRVCSADTITVTETKSVSYEGQNDINLRPLASQLPKD